MSLLLNQIVFALLLVHITTSQDAIGISRREFMLIIQNLQDEVTKPVSEVEIARSEVKAAKADAKDAEANAKAAEANAKASEENAKAAEANAKSAKEEAAIANVRAEKAVREAKDAKRHSRMLLEKLDGKTRSTLSPGNGREKRELAMRWDPFLRIMAPSSCSVWKKLGFRTSGAYIIDPDGNGLGEHPFEVHCDMDKGLTHVRHRSEGRRKADKCSGPKCYTRNISYAASHQHIAVLMLVSESCQQKVKIDCLESPLQAGSETLATWKDSLGVEHNFWSGTVEEPMCDCRVSNSCVNAQYSCSCDLQMKDWMLPVRALYFGSEPPNRVQVKFTLGRLLFTDRPPVPKSHTCEDVYVSGHRTSGFYLLPSETSDDQIDTVFCNMSDVLLNPGRNERIPIHLSDYVKLQEQNHEIGRRVGHLEKQGQCAHSWVKYRNSCYRSVTVSMNFTDMEAHCRGLHSGAHLVSIHSQEENDWISNNVPNLHDLYYWIGLRDFYDGKSSQRDWRYTDGTSHFYADWYPEEPNNKGGTEYCVGRVKPYNWKWNDCDCDFTGYAGVCKYNLYY